MNLRPAGTSALDWRLCSPGNRSVVIDTESDDGPRDPPRNTGRVVNLPADGTAQGHWRPRRNWRRQDRRHGAAVTIGCRPLGFGSRPSLTPLERQQCRGVPRL